MIRFYPIIPPSVEPITLEEAKNYLKVDTTADDSLIQTLITSARQFVENWTGRRMITQKWEMILDDAGEEIEIPFSPFKGVDKIEIVKEDGLRYIFPDTNYWIETSLSSGRVKLRRGATWPVHRAFASIIITFTVGYGNFATDVPEQLRQIILQVLAQFYEGRTPEDFSEKIFEAMRVYRELKL